MLLLQMQLELQFLAGYAEVRGGGCATVTSKPRANFYLAIGVTMCKGLLQV